MEPHEHNFYFNGRTSPTHVLISCDCGAEHELELPKEDWDYEELARREQQECNT